jgi:hypothetical protein
VHYRRSIQMDVSYQNSHPTSVIPAPDQSGAPQATSLIVLHTSRCWVPVDLLYTVSFSLCTTTYGWMLYPNSYWEIKSIRHRVVVPRPGAGNIGWRAGTTTYAGVDFILKSGTMNLAPGGQKKALSHLLAIARDKHIGDREERFGQTHLFNIWILIRATWRHLSAPV